MDINKMLAELRAEREQIEEAIMTLNGWHADAAKVAAVVHPPGCRKSSGAVALLRSKESVRKIKPERLSESRRSLMDVGGTRGQRASTPIDLNPGYFLPARRWIHVHLSAATPH